MKLQRVQYADDIEPLVQFIEDTPPSEIVDRTLEKLRAGLPIKTMLTASALAVTRSADLPPGHHGGPLHPLAGMYAYSSWSTAWRARTVSFLSCSTSRCPTSTSTTRRPGRISCWSSRLWMPKAVR